MLTDERIIIPQQLRQTDLDSLHLRHSGAAAMFDLCENSWFPHIHRTILWPRTADNAHNRIKKLRTSFSKRNNIPNEIKCRAKRRSTYRFCGPLPDQLNKEIYILVIIDEWSKLPTAKVVADTMADIAIKIMQRYISNNGVLRKLRCDQAQTSRAKQFQVFCNSNKL